MAYIIVYNTALFLIQRLALAPEVARGTAKAAAADLGCHAFELSLHACPCCLKQHASRAARFRTGLLSCRMSCLLSAASLLHVVYVL
jgi:hypothetical protein